MSGKLTKADYPPHWQHLRATVLRRADDACECLGECGDTHVHDRCNAPNHAMIVRDLGWLARWWLVSDPYVAQFTMPWKPIQVILTIAHLCQESRCDDIEHLRAMCQRCHLKMDAQQHATNAAQTRRRAQVAAGQLALLPEDDV